MSRLGARYLDIEISISGRGSEYVVSVVRSPEAGEPSATTVMPWGGEVDRRLAELEAAINRRAPGRDVYLGTAEPFSGDPESVAKSVGRDLFAFMLPGEVRSCYRLSREIAKRHDAGLRIRLRLDHPDLIRLPWEYMYDDSTDDFVALSVETPIVRYIPVDEPADRIAVKAPVRVLGMIAGPKDLPQLDTGREKAELEAAVAGLREAGRVQLDWVEGETWRDLQREIRGYHVFHFIGHGGLDAERGEGILLFSDAGGNGQPVAASELARLLGDSPTLKLVVLNSCRGAQTPGPDVFASTAGALVRRGVSAVIGMQHEIHDDPAIEFARKLYRDLAEGYPIDQCVSEARKELSLAQRGLIEWGTPVLFMRAPDGEIFEVEPPRPPLRRIVRWAAAGALPLLAAAVLGMMPARSARVHLDVVATRAGFTVDRNASVFAETQRLDSAFFSDAASIRILGRTDDTTYTATSDRLTLYLLPTDGGSVTVHSVTVAESTRVSLRKFGEAQVHLEAETLPRLSATVVPPGEYVVEPGSGASLSEETNFQITPTGSWPAGVTIYASPDRDVAILKDVAVRGVRFAEVDRVESGPDSPESLLQTEERSSIRHGLVHWLDGGRVDTLNEQSSLRFSTIDGELESASLTGDGFRVVLEGVIGAAAFDAGDAPDMPSRLTVLLTRYLELVVVAVLGYAALCVWLFARGRR